MFDVTALFDSLLLTRVTDAQRFRMIPLDNSGRLGAEAELITGALRQLGIDDRVDPHRWSERMRTVAPAAAVQFQIEASDSDSAFQIAEAQGRAFGDLLALHRGASGHLMATYVREGGSRVGRVYRHDPYRGNLVGGFISGEDADTLRAHAEAVERSPLLGQWMRLFAEAVSETRSDFAFARYWLVMELMAEALEPDLALADPDAPGGTISTSWRRVVALIRARSRGERGEAWVPPLHETLWEASAAWYGYRNAAMHHGGFDRESATQQRQGWYARVNEAMENTAADRSGGTLFDPYLISLRETTKILLHWELDAAAGFFDPGDPVAIALRR